MLRTLPGNTVGNLLALGTTPRLEGKQYYLSHFDVALTCQILNTAQYNQI